MKALNVIFTLLLTLVLVNCGGGGSSVNGGSQAIDYSGTYYASIASKPNSMMQIDQTGNQVTFTLDSVYSFTGQGTVSGNTMILSSEVEPDTTLNISLTFSEDGNSFSGTWDFVDSNGTITGSKTPWITYDVDKDGIPRFVAKDVLELDKISQISKLRSGAGHDYSDDFESCRSMKHYFIPKDSVDKLKVKVFSPINGTVAALTDDWMEKKSTWKGKVVCIKSKDYPAFYIIIYHIDLVNPLDVGDEVVAGQLIGYPADYANVTIADTAVGVITPSGYKLVSYFQVMTNSLFQNYQARGISSRDDMVITKEQRDADPLTCDGEEFLDSGHLENWVTLN